tara:strand:+ start:2709 stop:2885 length:177 start_codon:yes stop_codon:yes gene_type:complete
MNDTERVKRIEKMLKDAGLWVSQEGWEESDKDDEFVVSLEYLIGAFMESPSYKLGPNL